VALVTTERPVHERTLPRAMRALARWLDMVTGVGVDGTVMKREGSRKR